MLRSLYRILDPLKFIRLLELGKLSFCLEGGMNCLECSSFCGTGSHLDGHPAIGVKLTILAISQATKRPFFGLVSSWL